ncbi:MAG: translocation/assembly module TamB domain-containing protein [bacterium]|nr:MAG: translocation/assembly module TamB domain-containing protein [bacterium]
MASPSEHRPRPLGLRIAVAVPVGLLLIVLAGAVFLTLTEPGLRILASRVLNQVPGVSVDRVRGRLIGPVRIEGAAYRDGAAEVTVDQLELDWHPLALLRGRVQVSRLRGAGIRARIYGTEDPDPEAGGQAPFDLPVAIALEEGEFRDIAVLLPGGADPLTLRRVALRGKADRDGIDLKRFSVVHSGATLDLTGVLARDRDGAVRLDIEWNIRGTGRAGLRSQGEVSGPLDDLEVAGRLVEPAPVHLAGRLQGLTTVPRWEAAISFAGLSPAVFSPRLPEGDLTGDLESEGTLSAFTVTGSTRGLIAPAGEIEGKLFLKRDGPTVTLEQAEVSIPEKGGILSVRGKLRWEEALDWETEGEVRSLDPALLIGGWPGAVSFLLHAGGSLKGEEHRWSVRIMDIKGVVRDLGVAGSARMVHSAGRSRLEGLDLALGSSSIHATGDLDSEWNIDGSVNMPRVAELWDSAGGRIDSRWKVTGPRARARLDAYVTGEKLSLAGGRAESVTGTVSATLGPTPEGSFRFDAREVSREGWAAELVSAEGSGTPEDHRMTASVSGGTMPATVEVKGSYRSGNWNGSAVADLLTGRIEIQGSVTGDGTWSWRASAVGEGLNPGVVAAQYPGDISFSAEGEGRTVDGTRTMVIRVAGIEGHLRRQSVSGKGRLTIRGGGLIVNQLELEWGESRLSLTGDVQDRWDLNWTASVSDLGTFSPQAAGRAVAEGHLSGPRSLPRLSGRISGEELSGPGVGASRLDLSFDAGLGREESLRIEGEALEIRIRDHVADRAALEASGTPASHTGDLTVELAKTPVRLHVAGSYGEASWEGSMTASALDGTLSITGGASWGDGFTWEAGILATDLNPSLVAGGVQGRVSFRGRTAGTLKEQQRKMAFNLSEVKGDLAGRELQGGTEVAVDGDGIAVQRFLLALGEAKVTLSGMVGATWAVVSEITVPDLGSLVDGVRGKLDGNLEVSGTRAAPLLRIELNGSGLGLGTLSVDNLTLLGTVTPSETAESLLTLSAGGFKVPNVTLEEAEINLSGRPSSHRLDMILRTEDTTAVASMAGAVRDRSWQGKLVEARWSLADTESWALAEPGTVTVSEGALVLDPICLARGDGRLCLSGSRDRTGIGQGNVEWAAFPLSLLEYVGPPNLDLEGTMAGRARWIMEDGRISAEVRSSTSPGSLTYELEGAVEAGAGFRKVEISASLDRDGAAWRVWADLERRDGTGGDFLEWTLRVPGFTLPSPPPADDLKLFSRIRARIEDLDLLQGLLPDIRDPSGILTVDMDIGGPLKGPSITGQAKLEDGALQLPVLGLTLEGINLEATARGSDRLDIQGQVRSGGGDASVQADVYLRPSEGWPAELRFKGRDFLAADTPSLRILISPDLTVGIGPGEIAVAGTVTVPVARVEPPDVSLTTAPSEDVRVVDREPAERADQLRLRAEVTVVLGKKVEFTGFGLSGLIEGEVTALEEPGAYTTGRGEIRVAEGRYRAFGQRLTIERGRLIFAGGPIDDPGLDVRAVRKVGEVTAGVDVRGTLKEPLLTLSSEPPMDQSEILSYLMLGRPMRQASSQEGEVLSRAATAIGLTGGEAIAGRIGRAFGFEEVRVEAEGGDDQASLVVGRYLSPRIYVQYAVGLFEPVSVFRLGYQLSRRFLLQGESGPESGTDLIYTIEKD